MFERLTRRTESGIAYTKIPANPSNMIDGGECYTGRIIDRIAAYEDTGLTPKQIEDMKKCLKRYDDDRIAAQQECGSVCEDAIEMHQQIKAQQQEINLLIMEITELRESNQALKDYAENADADKDEQAGTIMRLDNGLKKLRSSLQWLKETLHDLDYKAWAEDNIGKIDALLGGKDGKE